jgi:hypothetical protein
MKCVVKNNSSMDMGPLLPLLKSLLPYSREKLGFNRPPSLFFASDTENAAKPLGKTAFYDPEGVSITIFVDGRHPKDILRSISHELVHHMQHERGDFGTDMDTGEGYAQKNDALRELEREAYESGNMCFRDWEDENRQALQEAKKHFNKENKKMSAKKKRNDNIESLLMKKWGFKEQTRQEFNIEVPDAKKSVLSEDLARHIVKEAIKKAGKALINEVDEALFAGGRLDPPGITYVDPSGRYRNMKIKGFENKTNKELAVYSMELMKQLDGGNARAEYIFEALIKSGDRLQREIAINAVPFPWTRSMHNLLPSEISGDVSPKWIFLQKDKKGKYIFDEPDDFFSLAGDIEFHPDQKKTRAHRKALADTIKAVSQDIKQTARSRAEERMKSYGLDAYGRQMVVDVEGGTKYFGMVQDDLSIARNDLEAKKREIRARADWRDKSKEEQNQTMKNEVLAFLKEHPIMLTTFPDANLAVSPRDPSWLEMSWETFGDYGVALGSSRLLSAEYNKMVQAGKIKDPDNPESGTTGEEDIPEVTLEQFTDRYKELIKLDAAYAMEESAPERARMLRDGTASLLSKQSLQTATSPDDLDLLALGTVGFDEVYASEAGRILDRPGFSAGDNEIFKIVQDKWDDLPQNEKPGKDDLEGWLADAIEEAEGQIGDIQLYNIRRDIQKTAQGFVPDYKPDFSRRARPEKTDERSWLQKQADKVAWNFENVLLDPTTWFSEEAKYDKWAAEQAESEIEVPPYDEYRGVRDIMNVRAAEEAKVPQEVQNEDLIRKVVQEALKRKFGE